MLFGIDLGTSFIKGAALDVEKLEIGATLRVPFPAQLPNLEKGLWEFDPDAIMEAVRSLLDELFAKAGGCEGILMCTQMHGLVLTTRQGQPRSNFISWQDQRLLSPHPSKQGSYFDVLKSRLSPDEIRELGNELRPSLPIGQCFWMAERGLLPAEDLIPASLADFVVANLCHCTPSTEATNAAAHGALHLEKLEWHRDVIARLGLDGLAWPEIRKQGDIAGWYSTGLQKIPCYTPVGDAQCALAGSLLQEDELSINIATGSQIGLISSQLSSGNFSTRPFFDGRYLNSVADIPAGRALNLLVGLLTELARAQHIELRDPWATILKAVEETGPTSMQANIAFFHSDCGDVGQLTNIREENLTVGQLFRAAFQNMADNYEECARRLSPEKRWRRIVFSGGVAQKFEILRRLICDRLQTQSRLSPTSEDTMLGLLAMALFFTGRQPSMEQTLKFIAQNFRAPVNDNRQP